jgi:hypothetical protein
MKAFKFLIFALFLSACDKNDTSGGGGGGGITIPAPPSNLAATATSSTNVNLTWNDNSTDEAGFKIERKMLSNSYVQIATVAANTVTYSDATCLPSTMYTYKMVSYNSAGSSLYTAEVVVTTPP